MLSTSHFRGLPPLIVTVVSFGRPACYPQIPSTLRDFSVLLWPIPPPFPASRNFYLIEEKIFWGRSLVSAYFSYVNRSSFPAIINRLDLVSYQSTPIRSSIPGTLTPIDMSFFDVDTPEYTPYQTSARLSDASPMVGEFGTLDMVLRPLLTALCPWC
jgi:hypothetical protein